MLSWETRASVFDTLGMRLINHLFLQIGPLNLQWGQKGATGFECIAGSSLQMIVSARQFEQSSWHGLHKASSQADIHRN